VNHPEVVETPVAPEPVFQVLGATGRRHARPLGVERVKERFIAPTTVPSTGAVRPQVAVAPRATAAMTPTVHNGQAQVGVRSWSPPA
jgi:hypothetical protein